MDGREYLGSPLYTGRCVSPDVIDKARSTPEYKALVRKLTENPFDLKREDILPHFPYTVLDLSASRIPGLGRLPKMLVCADIAIKKYNQDHYGARFEFDTLLNVVYTGNVVAYITFQAKDLERYLTCRVINVGLPMLDLLTYGDVSADFL